MSRLTHQSLGHPGGVGRLPLTPLQTALLAGQQIAPHADLYLEQWVMELGAGVDPPRWYSAWRRVWRRHPALRAGFGWNERGLPFQWLIAAESRLPFELLDLRDDPAAAEVRWEEALRGDRQLGFELSRPPCTRLLLAQLSEHDWRACWSVHHILVDGRSMTTVLREVFAIYDSELPTSPDCGNLTCPAVDDAFLRHLLRHPSAKEGATAAARDHWQRALAGTMPMGRFPCERSPTAQAPAATSTLTRMLAPELSNRLQAAATANAVTVNTLLQAAWGWALGLFSGSSDVVFGTLRAARPRDLPGAQDGVGLFARTEPVRVRGWNDETSVAAWLGSLRAQHVAASEHGWVGTAKIAAWLGMGGEHLLGSLLAFDHDRPDWQVARACGGDRGRRFSLRERADFSLILSAWAQEPMGLSLAHDAERYPRWAMEELLETVHQLLVELSGDPRRRLRDIPLVPMQRQRQRQVWNATAVGPLRHPWLHAGFETTASIAPQRLCLIDGESSWTYGDLEGAANRLAHRLVALGVGPEVRVALWLERSFRLPLAILATLKAGGAYIPMDRGAPPASVGEMLVLSSAQMLIVDDGLPAGLVPPAGCRLLVLAAEMDTLATLPPLRPAVAVQGQQLAYGIFTSGTTGQPKLVGIEHRSAANLVAHAAEELFEPADLARVPFIDNVAFDSCVSQLFVTWALGGTLLFHADLSTVFKASAEVAPTAIGTVPSVLMALLDEADMPATLRVVGLGGEAIPAQLLERLGRQPMLKVFNYYGPTETTVYSMVARVLGPTVAPLNPPEDRGSNLGHPIRNTEIHLLDGCGRPVPLGAPGEIHIAGLGVGRGYLDAPEPTAASFLSNPWHEDDAARLYRSGDLGFQLPDGSVEFLGRKDQQVKLRGRRLELGAIETALARHPALQDVIVLLREDQPGVKNLVAYIVGKPSNAAPAPAELRAFLEPVLGEALVPMAFVAIDSRPLTANGKLDRKALPAPSFAGDLEQRIPPSTELERQLHRLWAEVLSHREFGIADNFFMVGGHSLSAAQLVAAIASQLHHSMPVAAIFQAPTLREQVAWLTAQPHSASTSSLRAPLQRPDHSTANLVTLQPLGSLPPVFVVHGWGGTLGAFIDLARSLAPHRPVLGLQASAAGLADPELPSVRAMAADYADQILRRQPEGPIHLLGYSAGGWYAHAVAIELQKRGANLGLFAVLDTGVVAQVHRRLGLTLLWRHGLPRLKPEGSLRHHLLRPSAWKTLLRRQAGQLNSQLYRYLNWQYNRPGRRPQSDPFLALLKRDYRPERSSLAVDIFAPQQHLHELQRLWSFYASGGVRCHPLFNEHLDFYRPELAPSLAEAILAALERAEWEWLQQQDTQRPHSANRNGGATPAVQTLVGAEQQPTSQGSTGKG
jgi:amino acid adenylation domain-containing protein